MSLPSTRICFVFGTLVVIGLLGFAGYLQLHLGLQPCPLCQLQRIAMALVGLFFLLAAIHNPARLGVQIYGGLIVLFSIIGCALAGRQVWLQRFPPLDAGACGVGFDYLLQTLPLSEALRRAMLGTGDCAIVVWQLFGISIPGWTFLAFAALGFWAAVQMWRKRKRKEMAKR